jgi:hypothetical protein
LCAVVASCDVATGPHLILIGLLIAGSCCALLTARWALTAAASAVGTYRLVVARREVWSASIMKTERARSAACAV